MGAILGGWSYNGIWSFQTGRALGALHFCAARTSVERLLDSNPAVLTADYPMTASTLVATSTWTVAGTTGPTQLSRGSVVSLTTRGQTAGDESNPRQRRLSYASPSVTFSPPCLGCVGNLGRNSFVGPGNWGADMTLSKTFKFTERVNMKFDANGFNVFNRTNFILATAGGGAHNNYTSSRNFGQAAGTLNPRELQFGVKLSF